MGVLGFFFVGELALEDLVGEFGDDAGAGLESLELGFFGADDGDNGVEFRCVVAFEEEGDSDDGLGEVFVLEQCFELRPDFGVEMRFELFT